MKNHVQERNLYENSNGYKGSRNQKIYGPNSNSFDFKQYETDGKLNKNRGSLNNLWAQQNQRLSTDQSIQEC